MVLSESVRIEIQKWMDLYPEGRQRSAVLPALYVIQREFGYPRTGDPQAWREKQQRQNDNEIHRP